MIYNWQTMDITFAYVTDANGTVYDKPEDRFTQVDTETGVVLKWPEHHNFLEVLNLPAPLIVHFNGPAEEQKYFHDLVRRYNSGEEFWEPLGKATGFETTNIQNQTYRTHELKRK